MAWNVRELENVIQRAVLMAKTNIITENELIFDAQPGRVHTLSTASLLDRYEGNSLKSIMAEVEKEMILQTLKKTHGNVAIAAKSLQLGKTAFYDKMKRYDIYPKEHK